MHGSSSDVPNAPGDDGFSVLALSGRKSTFSAMDAGFQQPVGRGRFVGDTPC
jgi:hypothetical protein